MVMNPDGSWRPCSNYWWLNLVTIMDSYPLPKKANFADRLEGCFIFSMVDLRKGYHQILTPLIEKLETLRSKS